MKRFGLVTVLVVLAVQPAHAIAGRAWLERMASRADVIVLADVVSTDPVDGGRRLAAARVIKSYKGAVGDHVRFYASPEWGCDSSWAEPGEQALLFLHATKSRDLFVLAEDGRGRMVVRNVDRERFLEPILLDLPVDIRLSKHLDADGGWFIKGELASFDDIISYVENGGLKIPLSVKKTRYSLRTRCEDAGTSSSRRAFGVVPECIVWGDAAELQCRFADDDHSVAHCSRRAPGAPRIPFLQPSADLWCERNEASPTEPLTCTNHLSW